MEDPSDFEERFPRKLTVGETKLLNSVLPENKPGYKEYRDKISGLKVIGSGRFGKTNLILGKEDHTPNPEFSSAPVFAAGTVISGKSEFDIIIHAEADNEIEVDISEKYSGNTEETVIPEQLNIVSSWSYSDWKPGEKAPGDNSHVREIEIIHGKFIIAIAPSQKKIWLHEFSSGVNYLIPITNFLNQLMMIKNIRDISIVSNHNIFFNNLNNYADKEIISAFILYNKYFKRFSIDFSYTAEKSEKSSSGKKIFSLFPKKFFSGILKRGSN